MREIKFRAWQKDKKIMCKVTNIHFISEQVSLEEKVNVTNTRPFKDIVLMQYTGLKDKNGKEIYEGDIVKIKYKDEDIGKVIYEHNGFAIDVMNMNRPYGRVSFVNNFIEVIGNIWENGDLLNDSK